MLSSQVCLSACLHITEVQWLGEGDYSVGA